MKPQLELAVKQESNKVPKFCHEDTGKKMKKVAKLQEKKEKKEAKFQLLKAEKEKAQLQLKEEGEEEEDKLNLKITVPNEEVKNFLRLLDEFKLLDVSDGIYYDAPPAPGYI